MPKRISRSGLARRFNERGQEFDDFGHSASALLAYQRAIDLAPEWSVPWYNIGLVHKYSGRWLESLEANLKAASLDPSNDAAVWNAGISATALGDWRSARNAWKRYGIDVAEGDGPVDYPVGLTPVRIALDGEPEVIWAQRIDPARAIIKSVPLPTSGHRYGDLLLHDGAPNGYRKLGEHEVAVFDELELLQASTYSTFEVFLEGAVADEVETLQALCEPENVTVECWSSSLQTLCKACSEGLPWVAGGHDHPKTEMSDGRLRLGVAAQDANAVRRALETWLATLPGARLSEFACVLDANVSPASMGPPQ